MKKSNFVWLASIVLAAGLFWACDESGAGIEVLPEFIDHDGEANSLTVKPALASLAKGAEQQFTAYLAGKKLSSGISWTLTGGQDAGTTLSKDGGLLKVGSGETAEVLTVTAAVEVSGKKLTAKAVVTVLGNGGAPEEHGLSVSPGVVVIGKGYSQTFSAVFSKNGEAAEGVTWAVTGGVSAIDSGSGVLAVDGAETAAKLVVRAESDGLYGTAIVYVDAAPAGTGPFPDNHGIAVNPQAVTLAVGGAKTFTQTGAASVSWALESNTTSSITADGGVLTVSSIETAEKIVVKAAGTGTDSSKYGKAVVTVRGNEKAPGPAVVTDGLTVSPQTAEAARGGTLNFTAKDGSGATASGVSWRVLGGGKAGTAITGGALTVAADETANYLTVRAEAADGANGTATVTLSGGGTTAEPDDPPDGGPGIEPSSSPVIHGIIVEPQTAGVSKGGTKQFTAYEHNGSSKGAAAANARWRILESSHHAGTEITDTGELSVASGETLETLTILAYTGAETYGTAVVTVSGGAGTGGGDGEPSEPSGGGGQKTTLTIGPATAVVEKGGLRQFWAKDSGTTLTSGVTWSVSGGGGGTTITSPGGLLTVASTETAELLTVTAGYSGVTQTASIEVTAPVVSDGDPGTGTGNPGRSLKKTFGITTTGKTGVNDTFNAVHDFIASGGLTTAPTVIGLGDYIDLEGGLTVAAYGTGEYAGAISITEPGTGIDQTFETGDGNPSTSTGAYYNPNYKGKLLRIIVAGINSFNGKNGNNTPHVVFQFQNTPVSRRMNPTDSNSGGYPASEGRKYLVQVGNEGGNFLAGLTAAGVPDAILWGPKRLMGTQWNGAATQYIEDKLWLPTEWEMFGAQHATIGSTKSETAANQGRLEYYANGSLGNCSKRVKYNVNGADTTNGRANSNDAGWYGYWLASPSVYSAAYFSLVYYSGGDSNYYTASYALGFAPAFCVK
jgi:hypothetical protein